MKFSLEKLNPDFIISDQSIKAYRISQELWYLKIVSPNNYILQTDEYYWILPVTSKWAINQIFIPPFIQRINPIFKKSNQTINRIPHELIKSFPCGMLSLSNIIQNPPEQFTRHIRTNYFLKLDKPYDEIYKNYKNGHKLNLKQTFRQDLHISQINDVEQFVDFYLIHSHTDIPNSYKKKEMITALIENCLSKNAGMIYKAENKNKEILGCTFLTNYNNRIVYLLSSSSREGKKQFAMYAIIDEIIKQNCNSNYILDFEGSMTPGIAYFMKGFGAEEENYYLYEWNEYWLCKLKNKLKKLF